MCIKTLFASRSHIYHEFRTRRFQLWSTYNPNMWLVNVELVEEKFWTTFMEWWAQKCFSAFRTYCSRIPAKKSIFFINITAANQGVCPASWIKNNWSNFCEVDKLNGNAFIFQHKKVISIRTKYIFYSVVKFTSFISNFRITRNTKITTTNWTVQFWNSFVMEQKQE